ncbi:MAG TPA: hypothetical protein VGB78_01735 [Thermoplasmata archaeon]
MKWDFDTWLMQNYGLRAKVLNKKALELAKKEYAEEYPPEGESNIELKTFPFKKYLDSQKK